MTRREALKGGFKTLSLILAGSYVWSIATTPARARVFLRPPGALEESEFVSKCIKCSLCVEACPFGTLKLSNLKDEISIATPHFEPREIPCELCVDIPCAASCPTGALDIKSLKKDGNLDPKTIRMGIAVMDIQNCIAHKGIRCDACYRACPLLDKALFLKYERNDRTGKHAFLLPTVDADFCTGCGKCERACVTKEASIKVLPFDIALGQMGDNYVIGWQPQTDEKLKDASSNIKTDDGLVLDYLNDKGL